MSIAISESGTEDESAHDLHSEAWDKESGVFPRHQYLYSKASSTILGKEQRRGDNVAGTASTISGGWLRHEDSDSTLKYDHYDRQKSPLAVSQQTSESSARDLALRKGFPPVATQRSPLLQVNPADRHDQHRPTTSRSNNNRPVSRDLSREQVDFAHDKESRKKQPLKLDLSMLNPMARRRQSKASDLESLASSHTALARTSSRASQDSNHRKLTKVRSRQSLQSKYNIYDHYEQLPIKSPRMDRIPEASDPQHDASRTQGQNSRKKDESSRQRTGPDSARSAAQTEPFSWKNVRRMSEMSASERDAPRGQGNRYSRDGPPVRQRKGSGMLLSPASAASEPFSWTNVRSSMVSRNEASSAASISSRNTKASRHTNGSGISGSDLKVSSVLSLSSDSESERDIVTLPVMSTTTKASKGSPSKAGTRQQLVKQHSRQPSVESGGLTPRSHKPRNPSKAGTGQQRSIHIIPEFSPMDISLSHRSTKNEPPRTNHGRKPSRQSSRKEEKKSAWKEPLVTERPLQPTPPHSPTGPELRQGSIRSHRVMTVTKQEAALLEAMRRKKAHNAELEKIAKQHETSNSPPRGPNHRNRSRASEDSTTSTIRAGKSEHVLLYLETPVENVHHIDKAEPSPDLSDFLTFGSDDDDSTPRSSWAPPKKQHARISSTVLPTPKDSIPKTLPVTPPSAARLSAVGAPEFMVNFSEAGKRTAKGTGVRFVDDVHEKDFLLDDTDSEAVW